MREIGIANGAVGCYQSL